MPAGLECYKADGSLQLSYTDRTSLVVASGSAGVVPPGNANDPKIIRINFPGIKNDGRWYVTVMDYIIVFIYDGYFTLQRYEQFGNSGEVFYSVVRT